jgi:ribA/ribD-fused uncharacterized protein
MPLFVFFSRSKAAEPPFTPSAKKDLSNFSEFDVEYDGHIYRTVEHAFQALKYTCTERPELVDIVREKYKGELGNGAKKSGGKAEMKKYGVSLDVACWEKHKDDIMRKLIASKIERHPEIRRILELAKDRNYTLVHHADRGADMYWGALVKENDRIEGKNMLGKIYMEYSFKESPSPSPVKKMTSPLRAAEPNGNVKRLITRPVLKNREKSSLSVKKMTSPLRAAEPSGNVKRLITRPVLKEKEVSHVKTKKQRQQRGVCPPGKERLTPGGRCVKSCDPDTQFRDDKTRRCRVKKICPAGMERLTPGGRCVKICGPDQTRDAQTRRCRKNKTRE